MLLPDPEEEESEYQQCGALSAGAPTDNLGNRFAVTKLLTTKWFLSAFVPELACQLEQRQLLLHMAWVPRAQNEEADAITNGDVRWFHPAMQVKANMDQLPFLMLGDLLAMGDEFYKGIELVNAGDTQTQATRKQPLRVRDL